MSAGKNGGSTLKFPHLNHGNNQMGVRNYNEKLILQLVRNSGAITKADATRATGLSPNAISVIFKALEKDELILRGEAIRGKIGQPSMPMRLNPEFMYFFGFKIGRRSYELILMDFTGEVIRRSEQFHDLPVPEDAIKFVSKKVKQFLDETKIISEKIGGIGVAMPFELWRWSDSLDLPQAKMEAWKDFDLKSKLITLGDWPIFVVNDATAACGAELVFGAHKDKQNFVYLFIGTLIGGGIVLNGSVFYGKSGNAGGYGPMPIPMADGNISNLADQASMFVLERMLTQEGMDGKSIYNKETNWNDFGDITNQWVTNIAKSLAYAIITTLSIIDFDAIVIDGALPAKIKLKILSAVMKEVDALKAETLDIPDIVLGSYGDIARAIGAASLALRDKYMLNQNTLLRN